MRYDIDEKSEIKGGWLIRKSKAQAKQVGAPRINNFRDLIKFSVHCRKFIFLERFQISYSRIMTGTAQAFIFPMLV